MTQKENWLAETFDFVRRYHEQDRTGHDFSHIQRVYENACLLLKEEKKADPFIVKMAALLHDVDDRKLNFGEKQAAKYLTQIAVPQVQMEHIVATINAIDFATTGCSADFDTPEKAVLSDADKLDAMGAIGICRAVMYGHSIGRKLFDADTFPKKDMTKEEYKNLTPKNDVTINHFFDKLLKLPFVMQTQAGKQEALKRQQIMVDFLREFFRELNQSAWQTYLDNYLLTLKGENGLTEN